MKPRSKGIQIEIIPLQGIGEVTKGDNIAEILLSSFKRERFVLRNGDVVVVTHKIVSKAEGRVIDLREVSPSQFAMRAARHIGKDPRQVELILSESRRVLKMVRGLIISETRHGFVCANAGVDLSNVNNGNAVLLPKNPDESARKILGTLRQRTRKRVALIISDTFGRPWREGQVNVAIGLAGLAPFSDYRGSKDQYGYQLKATVICIADELASAAELVMNKMDRVPVAIIRGYDFRSNGDIRARAIARKPSRDLFR